MFILPFMVGIVPFFTMSAQCTYLSGMGKRKNRYLTIFDCRFGTVPITIDVNIFL